MLELNNAQLIIKFTMTSINYDYSMDLHTWYGQIMSDKNTLSVRHTGKTGNQLFLNRYLSYVHIYIMILLKILKTNYCTGFWKSILDVQ